MFSLEDFGLDPRSRRARMNRIGLALAAAWKAEAQESGLKSTLRDYKRSVVVREIGESYVVVSLVGELPNLLERGIPPHDMRKYLLSTVRPGANKIKEIKKGPRKGQKYRYISFRKKVSEIEKMGVGGVYSAIKSEEFTSSFSTSEGKLIYGSRLPSGLSSHYISKGGVVSSSDALAGLIKLTGISTAEGAANRGNNTYRTFRTVSYKRPEAWQHSGFKALRLLNKVTANMDTIIEEAGL